jgi:hypothetical protein
MKPFREEWSTRTVDETRNEGLLLGLLTLTSEESSRDLSGSIGLLDVINGEWEEVYILLGTTTRGDEYY